MIFTETAAPGGIWHDGAIAQGVPALEGAFAAAGISSEPTNDSSIFNDEDLAHFDALVMFNISGDPWTDEKAALERYQQAGGGIAAIHNAEPAGRVGPVPAGPPPNRFEWVSDATPTAGALAALRTCHVVDIHDCRPLRC